MHPGVEWLESQDITGTAETPSGRIVTGAGGWTTLAQIKVDACRCRTDWHDNITSCYLFLMSRGETYDMPLDPFIEANKRGSPA